jgi:hypothetical protein
VLSQIQSWAKKTFGGVPSEAPLLERSAAENIYHCCIPKSASQWVAKILAAPETRQYSGLTPHRYVDSLPGGADSRKITERTFTQPFPRGTIVAPIYITLENLLAVPKPTNWRAFFVMRDPRDVVVSWYFSYKHSHPEMTDVAEGRERLQSLTEDQGLRLGIDRFEARGLFAALRSWSRLPSDRSELMTIRYEELVGSEQLRHFQRVFAHCDIRMPEPILRDVLERNSFKALTKGREQGSEDVRSHLRKGVPGDWKNHFTPHVMEHFRSVTGDLVEVLGYAQ